MVAVYLICLSFSLQSRVVPTRPRVEKDIETLQMMMMMMMIMMMMMWVFFFLFAEYQLDKICK